MLTKRVTKALVKAQEKFKAETISRLEEYGAMKLGGNRDFTVPTPLGNLGVTVYEDWIACCFENAFAMAAHFGERFYNGKWNFHYAPDVATLTAGATDFFAALDRLMALKPTAELWAKARANQAEYNARWGRTE